MNNAGVVVSVAVLCSALALGGCKQKTVVDKHAEENAVEREKQLQARRDEKGKEVKKLKRLNWRAIAVAMSYAPGGRKRIDALGPEFPWKVDVFEETGDSNYDRVVLDMDRDGTKDEVWRFEGGRWTKFEGRLFWSGRQWVQAGRGEAALPDVATVTAGGKPLYKLAVEMLEHKATDYEMADYFAGHGPKASLFDDDWDARWDRADLDKDRDGKIDEKWLRKGKKLTRRVLADKKAFVYKDGHWVEATN